MLESKIRKALDLYGVRVQDNIDLSRLNNDISKAKVIADALMERGDARAFILGKQMIEEIQRLERKD